MQISLASKNIIAATGVVTLPVNADLAYWIECVGAVETVSKAFGTIDILVDNDGIGVIGYVEEANLTDRALCRLPEPGGWSRDERSAARHSGSEHKHGESSAQRWGAILHRFVATLNAHVHLDLCMLDGVVVPGRQGLAFRGAQVDEACVERMQALVRKRVLGLFERRGLLSRETVASMQGWGTTADFLCMRACASQLSIVQGMIGCCTLRVSMQSRSQNLSLTRHWDGNHAL